MASIDNRIVSMTFDNAKFEAGVAKTLATLAKLDASLKNIGTTNGLSNIEKAANKINLSGATNALDKLNAKVASVGAGNKSFSDIEGAANRVNFGPLGAAVEGIKTRLSSIATAPAAALDKLKEKLGFRGAEQGFVNIENAANKVKLEGPSRAADDLQKKLAFPGIEKGFANIEVASSKVKLGGITNAITEVTKGFSVLQGAAAVALGSIASKAAVAGGSAVKSLSLGPITAGFNEYATNLNSIQTILANTQFSGSTLKDVNGALAELNKYSDQTIYNFSEMAKNIGTFTAAGVDLKTSTQSIKGIANLAALSGSNSQQASTAMYQLSQAIASGRVSLQDWNSVVNAGMGGATFQRALATTASSMGTIADGALKVDKATGKATINGQSFRESITAKPGEQSWLTSDVLTNTLKQFTGDLSKAELAAMGFNDEQIKSIQATALTAKKAATEVKTISQAYDVVKESIGSGWAATFQNIFGDFEEAKSTFTSFTTSITGFVGANADARNKVLKDWKELGGRTHLISGIKNVFDALISVVKPIKDAFREIFPKKTGKDLYELTLKFEHFTEKLKLGPKTAENLKRTFAGFFAVLHIGKSILFGIIGLFGKLLGASSGAGGGILNFTGTIGDFLVSVDKALTKGGLLKAFFDGLGAILSVPLKLLSGIASAVGDLFGGFDLGAADGVGKSMKDLGESISPLQRLIDGVTSAWHRFVQGLGKVGEAIGPVMSEIAGIFNNFGDFIADALGKNDFSNVFSVIQTGLIGGIFLTLKKAFGKGLNLNFGGGLFKGLGDTMGTLNKSLVSLQNNVKAGTLLKISLALAALSVAVVALSRIDAGDLAKAMTAISVGLGELIGAMALLAKVGGPTAFVTMPFIASSMILLAVAMDALAISVVVLSKLSWNEIAKGLAGVGGALVAVAAGVKLIPPSIVFIGPALIPIAIAINLLAVAVKIFGSMDLVALGKGLLGIGGALTAVALGMKLMPPTLLITAAGLLAVGAALNVIAIAMKIFGSMDLKTIGKGLLGIGSSLTIIGVAMRLFPPSLALQAAGLVLVGAALNIIAGAVALMGNLSMKTIAKGLAGIGGALVVLGAGLKLMSGTIPGSIALLAAASALAILVPVIGILGKMKFSTIFKGLAGIGAAMIVVGAAGAIAAPGLTALGIALIPLGVGASLVAGSVYLLAKALTLLGSNGAKGIAALVAAFAAFVAVVPTVIINFIKGLVDIGEEIIKLAPKIVASMVKIVELLLDVVIKSVPKMAEATIVLIGGFLRVLVESTPKIISAGFKLLLDFLSGISNNIAKVVTTVGSIIVSFLTALAANIGKIIAAGATFLVKFLGGLVSQMPKMIAAGATAIVKFLGGLAQNIGRIVEAGIELIAKFVSGIAQNIGKIIAAGADLIAKFLKGVGDNVSKVIKAAADMMGDFVQAAADAIIKLTNRIAKIIINFINELASAIRSNSKALGDAGANLISAIIDGAVQAVDSIGGRLVHKILGLFGSLPGKVKKLLGIRSPSTVFREIGEFMMLGTSGGVDAKAGVVTQSIRSAADDMVATLRSTLSVVPDILDGLMDVDPVITPVLDLSNVQAGAKELAGLTNVTPITAAASYGQAASISAEQEAAQTAQAEAAPPPAEVKFEQNNYSPEALSTLDIYRRTKNQVSQAKGVLGII